MNTFADVPTMTMFKYRPTTRMNYRGRHKLFGSNFIKRYGKLAIMYSSLLTIVIIVILYQRIRRLSSYKDLGEARAEALNYALKRLPIEKENRDVWKVPRVDGAAIFSAYLETRPEVVLDEDSGLVLNETAWAMIRIIGVIPVKLESSSLMCYYRYRNKVAPDESHTTGKRAIAVRLVAFGENFGMEYCAAFVLCELPGRGVVDDIYLPHEVTITSEIQERPADMPVDEFVAVRYPKKGWKNSKETARDGEEIKIEDHSLAVCVQPFHHVFDKALDLVAFVEYYRMMGAGRFTFYRDSITLEVNEILNYYARENVATVIDWQLPQMYVFETNLRVDGIFAALNDCLYRSTFHDSYRYVAGVDVDEYIVPRKHENLHQLMEYLNPGTRNVETAFHGAWIFRNMFFYLMHRDDSTNLPNDLPKLNFHTKTLRWREVNPARDRSKFIVQGRDVIDLGNHLVWKMKKTWSIFNKRYQQITVDPEIAASQHYRKCETTVEKCWKRKTMLDRTAHRFTARLAQRVASVMKTIFHSTQNSSARI